MGFTVNRYRLLLNSDEGKYEVITVASSDEQAREQVKESQRCPDSSILNVELIEAIF